MSSAEANPPSRAWSAAAWLAPLAVAALAFGNGLAGGFVLDDYYAIQENPVVSGDVPAAEAFSRTFWGRPLDEPPNTYRPLAVLAFRLDRTLFGESAFAFHVVSLLAYLLLIHLGQRLSRLWLAAREACFAACLFAALPVHAENVASLVGRADTLALLLSLASLWALRPALAGGVAGPARLAAAAAAFLAALLCKESAAPLPLITAALIEVPRSGPRGDARTVLRRHLPSLLLLLVLAGYLVLRLQLIPSTLGRVANDDVLRDASPGRHLLYSFGLLAEYGRILAVPVDLCTGRKYAEVYLPDGLTLPVAAGGLLLAGLIAATVLDLRRRRPPFLLCAFLAWSVFSSLAFPIPEAMADRFLLAPTWFLALPVGAALARWSRTRRAILILALPLLLLQIAASAWSAAAWRTNLALLERGVEACPDSLHNHYRYAEELSQEGRHEEAVWHYAVAATGRRHFPGRWEHPAAEAERSLPVRLRLRQMHRLLEAPGTEIEWRESFTRFLLEQNRPDEARIVIETSPVPLPGPGTTTPPTPDASPRP